MKRFLVWRRGKRRKKIVTPVATKDRHDFKWVENFLMLKEEEWGEQLEGALIETKDLRSQDRGFARFKDKKQTLKLPSWQRNWRFYDKKGHLVKTCVF